MILSGMGRGLNQFNKHMATVQCCHRRGGRASRQNAASSASIWEVIDTSPQSDRSYVLCMKWERMVRRALHLAFTRLLWAHLGQLLKLIKRQGRAASSQPMFAPPVASYGCAIL